MVRYFSGRNFFTALISTDPEDFFERIVKTRNHFVHPTLKPHKKVILSKDMYLYQTKLRLLVYCVILLELGTDQDLMIERLQKGDFGSIMPLN